MVPGLAVLVLRDFGGVFPLILPVLNRDYTWGLLVLEFQGLA